MEKLIVRNGNVFDPLNNINGEKKDILIEKGKIVEKFTSENNIKEINANGKTIIPSAIDIHAHIASQQVNWIRLLGSKNEEFFTLWKGLTLDYIAKSYITNGYTFVIEANVYPSLSKQTIFNLINLPVLDKGMLLNVSNLWALEFEFEKKKIDDISYFISDLLLKCKGFGIKVYNPFEAEDWNFNKLRENIDEKGKLYNFSALDIYEILTRCAEKLKLPHSIHAHIEGYEQLEGKKNIELILEKINKIELNGKNNSKLNRQQIFHLAHGNSYNIDGDNNNLIDLLNRSKTIDLDLGFITFDDLNPIITSDRRFINNLMNNHDNNPNKIIKNAIELEGDTFESFRRFSKLNYLHCILWSNSIELALNIKNKWQIQLSLNFPHYSHVNKIPDIATWLLSKNARQDFMKEMNNEFLGDSLLYNSDKILDFKDYVIITRASPAKSLGISQYKGSFSEGADGDLNILDINLEEIDIEKNYEILKKALYNLNYVIKNGIIIKKKEDIDLNNDGLIYWTEGEIVNEDKENFLIKKIEFYQKYYSSFYDSMENSIAPKLLRKIE